ncbi:MAG: hypothetical protein WA690_01380 [Candidatus Acidiferrales bacterium]
MTRKMLVSSLGFALALALMTIAPSASAGQANEATQLTFNQPVQIPGDVVLPAGSYWFVMSNDIATHNFVRIYGAHRTHLITIVDVLPTLRAKPTSGTELTFAEQSRTRPIALLDWFYPGRLTGHEFVYTTHLQRKLAENDQITLLVQNTPQA